MSGRFAGIWLTGQGALDNPRFFYEDIFSAGEELNGSIGKIVYGPAGYFFQAEEFCNKAPMMAIKDRFRFFINQNRIRKCAIPEDFKKNLKCPHHSDPLMGLEFFRVNKGEPVVGHDFYFKKRKSRAQISSALNTIMAVLN